MAIDPAQILKSQIGELAWNNALLAAQVESLSEELANIKKEKTDGSAPSE